jgi:hypothetical protein
VLFRASEGCISFIGLGIAHRLIVRLVLPAHHPFEVLESDHDHSDVVQRLPVEAVFQYAFDSKSAILVH